MDEFARMNAGTVSPADFFAPENVDAMTGAAASSAHNMDTAVTTAVADSSWAVFERPSNSEKLSPSMSLPVPPESGPPICALNEYTPEYLGPLIVAA
jgi:hypothetical protein